MYHDPRYLLLHLCTSINADADDKYQYQSSPILPKENLLGITKYPKALRPSDPHITNLLHTLSPLPIPLPPLQALRLLTRRLDNIDLRLFLRHINATRPPGPQLRPLRNRVKVRRPLHLAVTQRLIRMFLRVMQCKRNNVAVGIAWVADLLARLVRTYVVVFEAFARLAFVVFGDVEVDVCFVGGVVGGEVAFDAADFVLVGGEEVFELPARNRGWDGGVQTVGFAVFHVLFLVLDCLAGWAEQGDVETWVVGWVEWVVDRGCGELEDHVAASIGHSVPVWEQWVGVHEGQVGVPGVLGLVPC